MSLVERQISAVKCDMKDFIAFGFSIGEFINERCLSSKNFTMDELEQLWKECLEEEETR